MEACEVVSEACEVVSKGGGACSDVVEGHPKAPHPRREDPLWETLDRALQQSLDENNHQLLGWEDLKSGLCALRASAHACHQLGAGADTGLTQEQRQMRQRQVQQQERRREQQQERLLLFYRKRPGQQQR